MVASIFLLFVAFITVAAIAGRIDQPPVSTATKPVRSAPSTKAKLAKVHGPERVLVEDLGRQYCIGGTLCPSYCEQPGKGCEARPFYSLKLDRPANTSRIELHAEDEVGITRKAELVVQLNGRQLGTFPVNWTGSTITIPVNRAGQRITIEARDPLGVRLGGEEAVISDIHVFGRELLNE